MTLKQTLLVFLLSITFQFGYSQNTTPNDTISQNYHRSDEIKPTNSEALVRLLVMDFRKNRIGNMPLWVWNKKTNQYWQGITDENGEAFFLLPNNNKYTVNLNEETDYRKFTIPKEKKLTKTFKVVCMSTRIQETERNDTIFQKLAPGQMPTQSRVLVNIKMADFENQPLVKESIFYVSQKSQKVYAALTNSQGKATLMLPKGDTYFVSTCIFQNLHTKTYEDRPSSRTSTLELECLSTEEFKRRKAERARLLAERDSTLAAQRLEYIAQISKTDRFNFYLQHYFAKLDAATIEKNVLNRVSDEKEKLAKNPRYYVDHGQEISAMLQRNKDDWKQKRIVANIDCSMYKYIDELLVWNYSDDSERSNNTYWLFNGFQNKSKKSNDDHHSRGIYHVVKNDVEGFATTIDKIVNFSCGANRLENVVEALIIGAKDKQAEEELLFIADNYSDASDLHKLNQLKTPVRVLLTASTYGINEHYLEIAYRTGGSVHTKDEDISKDRLRQLEDGDLLVIGGRGYTFMKGRFLKQRV
ncbi:MAG: hypothetical protein AB8F74_18615 [Saprospiraceae bacterium]